jgi:hypothetical protein
MSYFSIRLVLRHGEDWANYDRLHDAMESGNFYRKIQAESLVWYDLPHGEYQYGGNDPKLGVVAKVAQIARQFDASIRVIVTEGLSAWSGLDISVFQGGPTMEPPALDLASLLVNSSSPFPPSSYRGVLRTAVEGYLSESQ